MATENPNRLLLAARIGFDQGAYTSIAACGDVGMIVTSGPGKCDIIFSEESQHELDTLAVILNPAVKTAPFPAFNVSQPNNHRIRITQTDMFVRGQPLDRDFDIVVYKYSVQPGAEN